MKTSIILTALLALTGSALALTDSAARADDSARLSELERKLDVLTEELQTLKSGPSAAAGFGDSSSASRVSIGGYGETLYENFRGRRQDGVVAASPDRVDNLRAVLYVGYKFTDKISLTSEYEFEHANDALRGEVSVENLQLDFRASDALGLRAGLLLVPVGIINELHEPITFHGAKRPRTETDILPSTWRENGVGVFGEIGPLSYRSYVVAGLQAVSDGTVKGFNASSGVRGGRSKGSNSRAQDLAFVSQVNVSPAEDMELGLSVYSGQADQQMAAGSVPVAFWDVHGKAAWRGLEVRGLYVEGRIGGAELVNVAQGIAAGSNASVGSELFGGYAEAAFDVLSLRPKSVHYLAPFFRYERVDTQFEVPAGWKKNPSNSRVEYTVGVTYKPIPRIAAKFDHQFLKNQGLTGIGQTNLALGYVF